MRAAALFLIATAVSAVPRATLAQVSVTSPAPGAASSYRNTVVSWDPIPGASSYHLEIDDDPNFGSPEVDVTVAETSYKLSGERLKYYGYYSGAAYIRINGSRWNAGTFSPTYMQLGRNPSLRVDSHNQLYLAFEDGGRLIQLTTSSNWANTTRLSLPDTFNPWGLHLVVDENDVAHAAWYEQRWGEGWVPYYTNSSTGWTVVRIPGLLDGSCSEGALVAGAGQVDIFYDDCGAGIDRWTTTDGLEFTRTLVPNNDSPNSVTAARDGMGNLFVVSERYTGGLQDLHSSLQTPADGWIPHRLGPGRFPALAVTPSGEKHVLRWATDEESVSGQTFMYSNSLRDFESWTQLPATNSYFEQDILPLVIDETGQQIHAALPGPDGIRLCSAAHTGQAIDTGTSWTCASIGDGDASGADLALAPDGTLHLAWRDGFALGYANSLGSFLATNLKPQVRFAAPSGVGSAAIVPTTIFDPDSDDMSGEVQVGRLERVTSRLQSGSWMPFLQGIYRIDNVNNAFLSGKGLQFRVAGGASWESTLDRTQLPSLPAMVEVRHTASETTAGLVVMAWDNQAVTLVQGNFVPSMTFPFSGSLPSAVDISALPDGEGMVAITVTDGSNQGLGLQDFTKTSEQVWLVLTEP